MRSDLPTDDSRRGTPNPRDTGFCFFHLFFRDAPLSCHGTLKERNDIGSWSRDHGRLTIMTQTCRDSFPRCRVGPPVEIRPVQDFTTIHKINGWTWDVSLVVQPKFFPCDVHHLSRRSGPEGDRNQWEKRKLYTWIWIALLNTQGWNDTAI